MMKAYDIVDWEYLQAIVIKLGFSQHWTSVIMNMVSSISFSVMFNGMKLEEFKPTKGIRQGDPLSPYLFLLASEGLSCLLKSQNQSSQLNGIKVDQSALRLTTYFLLMIASCFLKQIGKGRKKCQTFWTHIVMPRVR
jgi:hypothetical protein